MLDKRKTMKNPIEIVQITESLFQDKRKYNINNRDIKPKVDDQSSDTDNINK